MVEETSTTAVAEEPAPVAPEAPPGAAPELPVQKPPESGNLPTIPEDRTKEAGSVGEHKIGDITVRTF
jgi:hypothetical protein